MEGGLTHERRGAARYPSGMRRTSAGTHQRRRAFQIRPKKKMTTLKCNHPSAPPPFPPSPPTLLVIDVRRSNPGLPTKRRLQTLPVQLLLCRHCGMLFPVSASSCFFPNLTALLSKILCALMSTFCLAGDLSAGRAFIQT